MKYLGLILITIFAGLIVFTTYYFVDVLQRNALEESLTSEISNMQQEGITCCLEMRKITNFEWDKLFIFLPFTDPDYIENVLEFEWNNASKVYRRSRDDLYLLIFVKENRVVEYLEFSSTKDLLFDSFHPSEFTPTEALFEVRSPKQ